MKNSPITSNLRSLFLALSGLLCAFSSARADEIELLVVAKEQRFVQTSAAAPVLHPDITNRFGIFVLIQADLETIFTRAIVSNSVIGANTLDGELGGPVFENHGEFSTKAELDMNVPPGTYTFHIGTTNGSNFTATVTLPADAYPNAPHIANWTAAQNIDPFANFTLRWDAMTGGGAQDFIYVNIQSDFGDEDEIFVAPFIGQPGRLTGQSNSVVIPAGTLQAGRTYRANVTFVNFVFSDTNILGGGFLGVGFVKETEFSISTDTVPAQGRIQFANTNLAIVEGSTNLEVTLLRVGGTQGEVSVRLLSANLSATAGADYNAIDLQRSFGPGETNLTVLIAIQDDALLEGAERFRLGLSNPQGGVELSRDTNAIVTILDSESAAAGKLTFSAAAYQVVEGPTNIVKVIVRREGGTVGAVGATIEIFDGTATYEDDYEADPGLTMTVAIADGKNSSTNEITILDDSDPEGNETIIMRLANPTGGAVLGKIGTNTTTILDDEITIQFEETLSTNIENKVEARIQVVRSGPSTEAASVDYTTPGFSIPTGDFVPATGFLPATPGEDYIATNGTLFFPRGVVKKSIMVRIIDDLLVETQESINLTLTSASNANLGDLRNATLYIKDNDLGGTINFVMTNQNVKESVGDAKIMVTRTGGLASNVTVRLSTVAGTATDGLDYIGFTTNLTFGAKEGKKTIPLSVIQDFLVEDTERLTLILTDVSNNASNGPRTNLTVNIADDDKGGTISFDKILHSVNESVTNLALIIKRTGGGAGNVTVRLQSANGPTNSATAGSDYLALDTVITFGPGETRKTNTLHIINDSIADAALSETIALSLREYTGGAKPGASNAVVAIIDDESSVSFASATTTGVENQTVTITVVRGGFLGSTSTVEYMFMDGTATNGSDYKGTNGTLTFLPKQFSKTITVPIISDLNTETNLETFTVILKNATNALLGTITTNTVSITDAPAVGAIPLDRPEFLKAVTRGVTNSSFNRSITINDGGVDFIQLSAIGNNYGIQARDNIFSPSGSEAFLISINNVTGPGVFNVTPNGL